MSIFDPFVRWISGENGAPIGFARDDDSRGSLATYPESPDAPYSGVTFGAMEVRHQAATYPLSTTPGIVIPDTLVTLNGLVSWDAQNGIVTINAEGVYDFLLMVNVSSANQRTLYFYAEIDTGAGFQKSRWTGRQARITANTSHQTIFVSTNYFAKGTRYKIYLFSSDNDVSLSSADLPGLAGIVTVPAIRMMVSGAR